LFSLRLDYNVSHFNGKKHVTLANSSILGGKNQVMGAIFMAGGNFFLF